MIFNPLWLLFIFSPFFPSTLTSEVAQFPYHVQYGTPIAIPNFVDPLSGCDWAGVAGQIFDDNHNPVDDYIVVVNGFMDENPVNEFAITGAALQIGPGGFEITLSNGPADSFGSLYLELFEPGGEPASRKIFFDTYNDCYRNLILINLIEFNSIVDIYLPILYR